MAFHLNPNFTDGTRLRSTPAVDSEFSGAYILNDAPVEVVEISGDFLRVRDCSEGGEHAEGWVRDKNIVRQKRTTGLGLVKLGGGAFDGLAALASEAMDSKVHLDHEARNDEAADLAVASHWFLSYKLMMREVLKRRGDHSWQAKTIRMLHSAVGTWTLIVLLLLDVMIVFVELFLEGSFPACEIIERDAISCCAAPPGAHHRFLSDHSGGGHHHSPMCDGGDGHVHLAPLPGNGVFCDPHAHAWVHQLETWFSLVTVLILSVFLLELFLLLGALGTLFFRSLLHIFDLAVVSLSLGLQLYIFIVRAHGAQAEAEDSAGLEPHADMQAGEAILPDDIQGLILFSRCWRFVRVGHGIATSVNDMVRNKQAAMHKSMEELKEALRLIEKEHSEAVKEQAKEQKKQGGGIGTKDGSMARLNAAPGSGLHRAHDALTKLAKQAAY